MRHAGFDNTRGRGVTMVEAVMSMVVLSGAMVAALNAVGGARATQVMAEERAKGRILAESMLTEVLAHDYAEPGSTTLGPDTGEAGAGTRSQYDDVDDFHGWSNTVREPDGAPYPGFAGYTLAFTVDWVVPTSPGTTTGNDLGAKRVTVTVTRAGRAVAELQGWATAP